MKHSELIRLLELAMDYAHHGKHCTNPQGNCDCGLEELKEEIQEVQEEES